MLNILRILNEFVWGVPALVLILGVGLYLSVRTGFAQIRFFPQAVKTLLRRFLGKEKTAEGSPFQALCTALAATVGTGNLAGVAGAIALGGPGSIFWMWVCALVGMVTKYAEAVLAVRYQVRNQDGSLAGGPMHIITRGLGTSWKPLAFCYCFFGVVAAFGVGTGTQINAVITGINTVLSLYGSESSCATNLMIGLALGILVTLMVRGGARQIGEIAERLVPFAAIVYILLSVGVLAVKFDQIPRALHSIITGAFSPRAVTGGMIGSAAVSLRIGVSRGVFTNEAGMGTASIAHGSARVKHPVEQGLLGIMEVFLDTVVICTLTALVILVSGVSVPYGIDEGLSLTSRAFAAVYGDWVSALLVAETGCFAFATILGWGLYGARCSEFLFGNDVWKHFALIQGITVVLSSVWNTEVVWLLSDTINGLMALPNLIALAYLSPEVVRLTKDFDPGRRAAMGLATHQIEGMK